MMKLSFFLKDGVKLFWDTAREVVSDYSWLEIVILIAAATLAPLVIWALPI